MELAKPAVDVGMMTNDLEPAQRYWGDEVGLAYEELLKVGGGIHQHRYALYGAVLKLNSHRDPLDDAPSGLVSLRIATTTTTAPIATETPDGVSVTLVPRGHDGIDATEITIASTDPDADARLFATMRAERLDDRRQRLGETLIAIEHDPERDPTGDMNARGFRYLTVQVTDVVAAHAEMLDAGASEGRPPVTLGETAAISFVRLTDGDWVELSQRASLTGAIPQLG